MKTKYLLFVLPLMALCACNKEGLNIQENNPVSISASCGTDTKTILTETNPVSPDAPYTYAMSWSGNEELYVRYINPITSPELYTFAYYSETDGVAMFKTDTFKEGGFQTGNEFLVCYPNKGIFEIKSGNRYYWKISVPSNQTYNPSNSMGLANNLIPMYGFIKVGDVNYSPLNVKMSTPVSIIKLILTNGTVSAQTINHITLTTDLEGIREGLAGIMVLDGEVGVTAPKLRYKNGQPGSDTHPLDSYKKTITLNCGNVVINAGDYRQFSFIVCGEIILGNLTWQVWADAESTVQIGTDITSANCPALEYGKVYTKTATL